MTKEYIEGATSAIPSNNSFITLRFTTDADTIPPATIKPTSAKNPVSRYFCMLYIMYDALYILDFFNFF